MAGFEVQPNPSVDMTWYTGSVLGPLEQAENLVEAFAGNDSATLGQLSLSSGMSEDEIVRLLPLMVRRRLIEPIHDTDLHSEKNRSTVLLTLGTEAQRPIATVPS